MPGYWIVPPPVPLVEPVAAQEFSIDNIGGIYYNNGILLMPLYRVEIPVETPGAPPERVVKVKLSTPIKGVPQIIGMMARVLWPPPHAKQPETSPPSLRVV